MPHPYSFSTIGVFYKRHILSFNGEYAATVTDVPTDLMTRVVSLMNQAYDHGYEDCLAKESYQRN